MVLLVHFKLNVIHIYRLIVINFFFFVNAKRSFNLTSTKYFPSTKTQKADETRKTKKKTKIPSQNYFKLLSIFDTQNRANLFDFLALIIFVN